MEKPDACCYHTLPVFDVAVDVRKINCLGQRLDLEMSAVSADSRIKRV